MATVLYITAHPLDPQESFSLAVGKEFIEAYREANPTDEVVHLDLYKENIPPFDADVLRGWEKLRSGSSFDQLSEAEQSKVARLDAIVDQYVAADKYVYVSPMWNFSVPPVLKAYTDATSIPGKTFKYTKDGPIGLLSGKKALHIQASGSVYSEGPLAEIEMGYSYLRKILQFYGIQSLEAIFAEGTASSERAPAIKEKAIAHAKEAATRF
ncbi:FMN-dependent NADH-azoreductase [Paenibacillus cellulosilyticus]|uniref:FMN dependent NADH:quinone oxidoreductase n=1 Tax=Paenibacillus cellulosilyticus TaxID=375489 RepID=A0A2V2YST6_9BACL|nr:NAD(P)H-dependent oxidoreductase [Paenibacillus cellulosilyticus]PWW02443.1 FMN-dependent NADH-azoreductase [Paenibacillus cellulosilyticus]QKS47152.1 NAD(P)H-dependent oxidoreductase [Paenibacillus cellulosilyticus]